MKKYVYILSTICLMGMTSCDSFLEREPLDFGKEQNQSVVQETAKRREYR